MRLTILTLACKGLLIRVRCHVRFATLVDKKRGVRDDIKLENCQSRYRSNTWMGRTRTGGPDEFEPSKFDCKSQSSMIFFFFFKFHDFPCMELFFLILQGFHDFQSLWEP